MSLTLQATATDLIPASIINEQDWRVTIIRNLTRPSPVMVTEDLKDFTIVNGELYYQYTGGVMTRACSMVEAKEELQCIHDLSCDIITYAFADICKGKNIIGLR